jgi:MoaA/NifB/PqqE/SkfB family radical SAM enzyme
MRAAHLPFGDWYYFPRTSLNLVNLAHNPEALWKPVHISIALTARCEKDCDFCYAESVREGATHWKLEQVVKMVESCDRHGVFAVTLGGGEPLLWNDQSVQADFYDLLNELSAFGCAISFTTSAHPTVEWDRIPPSIRPRISLHHYREIAFVQHEINRARACGGSMPAVNIVVHKGAIAHVLIAAEKLAEAGVRDFLLLPLRPVGRAFGSPLVPTEEELRQLVRLFPVPNVKLSSCYHLEHQNDTFLGCGAGDWFVSIDEKHGIKACSFSKTGIALVDFDYQEIVEALPLLNRLECHKRIRLP